MLVPISFSKSQDLLTGLPEAPLFKLIIQLEQTVQGFVGIVSNEFDNG